jgi:hypothetical protein
MIQPTTAPQTCPGFRVPPHPRNVALPTTFYCRSCERRRRTGWHR